MPDDHAEQYLNHNAVPAGAAHDPTEGMQLSEFMPVQLIGGPYDGQFAAVRARTDEVTGEPVPDNLVYSCPDPTVPDALVSSPGAEGVLGEDPRRRLSYNRERRGDRWVYALHGDADPVLEALLRHIRE